MDPAKQQSGIEQYDALLKNTPKAVDFAKTLDESDNQAFSDYLKMAQGQEKPLDFYTKTLDAAGVPQMRKTQSTLQGQIYDLEDSLRRVEPDVSATTRESIVTDAQRRGMVGERQKPIVENLGWIGQSLGRVSNAISTETTNATNLTGLNQQGQQMELDPYKMRINMVSEQNARKMTGFTTDLQNELQVGLSKIKRGEELDDREFARVAELAKLDKQYQLEKEKAASSLSKDRYISVGDKSALFDVVTGKFINNGGGGSSPTPTPSPTPKPTTKPSSSAGTPPPMSAKAGVISGNWYSTGAGWVPIVP